MGMLKRRRRQRGSLGGVVAICRKTLHPLSPFVNPTTLSSPKRSPRVRICAEVFRSFQFAKSALFHSVFFTRALGSIIKFAFMECVGSGPAKPKQG